ncbi:hypothetical protein D5R81_10545, partial [Parashewanella spongiae]
RLRTQSTDVSRERHEALYSVAGFVSTYTQPSDYMAINQRQQRKCSTQSYVCAKITSQNYLNVASGDFGKYMNVQHSPDG